MKRNIAAALAATLSGVLVFLSFPRWDLWPLAFVAPLPLLWATRHYGRRGAFALGAWTGLVTNLGGFYWITGLLEDFGGMPPVASIPLYALLCAQQGLVFAVAALLNERLRVWGVWSLTVRWPVAFVAAETCCPMIFKWYYGNSQYLHTALAQTAELGGPVLISAVLAIVAGASADAAVAIQARRAGAGTAAARSARAAGAGIIVFVIAEAWGAVRIGQIDQEAATADALRVGVVEADLGIDEKATDGLLDSNLLRHQRLSADAVGQGAELIVWPETAYEATRFYQTNREHGSLEEARQSADAESRLWRDVTWMPASPTSIPATDEEWLGVDADRGVPQRGFTAPLLTGAVLWRQLAPEERPLYPPYGEFLRSVVIYNSALLFNTEGRVLGVVDKHGLMPFSEHVAFGHEIYRWFGINLYQMIPAAGDFVVGEVGPALELPRTDREPARIGVMICYEDIMPWFGRELAQFEPNVLINVTNDAWFGDTSEPWLHLALATFRSIELRTSLVRSVNTGVSAVIDPVGRIVAHTATTGAEVLVRDVPLMTARRTPYVVLGNWSGVLAVVGVVVAWGRHRRSIGPRTANI